MREAPARRLGRPRAATEPPGPRGLGRDQVRLLVSSPRGIRHASFRDLGDYLDPGDVVVVNTSATLPAAVAGNRAGRPVGVHFSSPLDDGSWVVELRKPDGAGPLLDGRTGETVDLDPGGRIEVLGAYYGVEGRSRMLKVRTYVDVPVDAFLAGAGRPISYSHARDVLPLSSYQTVFSREPGSAEMPSAARPFTEELVVELVVRGIVFAPVVLHSSVSSLERGETPMPERYNVPAATARLVNEARSAGARVVAVGTTVTRALETAATPAGDVRPSSGWTDLVLGPDRPARVVDGLVTGWHPPEASHQLLLEAVAGPGLVGAAYAAALEDGYLWHEFGDSCLLLPDKSSRPRA